MAFEILLLLSFKVMWLLFNVLCWNRNASCLKPIHTKRKRIRLFVDHSCLLFDIFYFAAAFEQQQQISHWNPEQLYLILVDGVFFITERLETDVTVTDGEA